MNLGLITKPVTTLYRSAILHLRKRSCSHDLTTIHSDHLQVFIPVFSLGVLINNAILSFSSAHKFSVPGDLNWIELWF